MCFCGSLYKEKEYPGDISQCFVSCWKKKKMCAVTEGKSNKPNWQIEITVKHGYDYVCKLR